MCDSAHASGTRPAYPATYDGSIQSGILSPSSSVVVHRFRAPPVSRCVGRLQAGPMVAVRPRSDRDGAFPGPAGKQGKGRSMTAVHQIVGTLVLLAFLASLIVNGLG